MNIGHRIKYLRKQKGMSIEELANKLGKNKVTVYRYEKGEISNLPLDILEPLAKALDTSPQYLMGWENNELVGTRIQDGNKESIYFAVSEKNVKHVEIWHKTFGIDAFTDEEFEKLLEYAKFLKSLR